jgi:hypothetical protein
MLRLTVALINWKSKPLYDQLTKLNVVILASRPATLRAVCLCGQLMQSTSPMGLYITLCIVRHVVSLYEIRPTVPLYHKPAVTFTAMNTIDVRSFFDVLIVTMLFGAVH